jgi:hypothetical protein
VATRNFTLLAAATVWFGVVLQLYLSLHRAIAGGGSLAQGLASYFGYFTILTNIFVALALTAPLAAPASTAGGFFGRPGVQTAAAAAITLVSVAYALLLRHVWDPQGWQLVADRVLHYASPLLFLAHWWIAVPKRSLRWSDALAWASYPLAYFAYLLLRGLLLGEYSYYFVDVHALGYARTLLNALGLLVGFLVIAFALVAAARWQRGGE